MDTETIKEQGFQPGKGQRNPVNLPVNALLALDFLHSKFGRYFRPDGEDHRQGDLTQLIKGCAS